MQLALGTEALKAEVQEIVGDSLNDSLTARYVSQLLLEPLFSGMREIRFDWWIQNNAESVEKRLSHSRQLGDRCFNLGVFYLDDLERQGQYQLIDLGKA